MNKGLTYAATTPSTISDFSLATTNSFVGETPILTLAVKYPSLIVLNSKFEYKFDKFDITNGLDSKADQTVSVKSVLDSTFLSQYPLSAYPPDTGYESIAFIAIRNNVRSL